jgi:hypothetical protein
MRALTGWQKAYTGFNVRDCPSARLVNFDNWIEAMQRRVPNDTLLLYAEPATTHMGDYYEYYCMDPRNRCVGWLRGFDGVVLFQECPTTNRWEHKSM